MAIQRDYRLLVSVNVRASSPKAAREEARRILAAGYTPTEAQIGKPYTPGRMER